MKNHVYGFRRKIETGSLLIAHVTNGIQLGDGRMLLGIINKSAVYFLKHFSLGRVHVIQGFPFDHRQNNIVSPDIRDPKTLA
jgi:hypothetical protein